MLCIVRNLVQFSDSALQQGPELDYKEPGISAVARPLLLCVQARKEKKKLRKAAALFSWFTNILEFGGALQLTDLQEKI